MRSCDSSLLVAVAVVAMLVVAASSEAQGRRVLMLQSLDRGNLTLDYFTGNFRVDVDRGSSQAVTYTQFVVNPPGFDDTSERAIVGYLRALYAGQPEPDLIVTVGGTAAMFARQHRDQLFPNTPRLLAAVDERFLQAAPLGANETAVAVRNEMARVIGDALQLIPSTRQVFIIAGSGELGRFWRAELGRELRSETRASFIWSDQMTFAEMMRRVASLPPDSIVFYLAFDTDAQGGAYPEERLFAELRAASNAPMFGGQDRLLGHGFVGGRMMATEALGSVAADAALRILRGEPAGGIRVPVQLSGPPTFDWRELQRWNISESRLPQGSVIRFREPSAWQRYRTAIVLGMSALVAQALLIAALLANRRKRQRAERSLRDNVADLEAARGMLSQLSGRLMQAQEEERVRLARELHDDLGQRLSFLAMDVARLRETLRDDAVSGPQARHLQEAVLALGREVQGISHRLHSSKIDLLGLPAAAASFCNELATRQHMAVSFTQDGVPASLPEGVAITLFRVLQEALANAAKHAHARQCRVTLRCSGDDLVLEVKDDGRGFEVVSAVSGVGLGLISMQERLKLVNGDVVIDSNAGQGTTVRARVPIGAAARQPVPPPAASMPVTR